MGECNDILTELESWYRTPLGQSLYRGLQDQLEPLLETTFGYHLVQVGCSREQPLFCSSRIRHQLYIAEAPGARIGLQARADELPLESDSVDVLIAHHSLEFTEDPHAVLRELHRVLTPQGHLLLVGFNPWSLLALNHHLRAAAGNPLWRARRAVSRGRLLDWLRLLGCEAQGSDFLLPLPVASGEGRLARLARRGNRWSEAHQLPFGSLYLVHAIKQVAGRVRPLRLARTRPALMGIKVGKPAPTPTPRGGNVAACAPIPARGDAVAAATKSRDSAA